MSDDNTGEYQKILKKGNLIAYQDDFFLCLGDEISFVEQYDYKYEIKNDNLNLIYEFFLSDNTLKMIDWMVYYRYSNYKSVIKYFVSFDVQKLIESVKVKNKKKKIENNEIIFEDGKIEISENKIEGQQLIIFPDLWTLFNTLDATILSAKGNVLLSSNDSQNKKNKNWWMIKNGQIKNVFCTHSELFQDWNNLKNIFMIDPYKRYYENQQDPRYSVRNVVEKMCEIYGAELKLITQ